MLHVEGLLDWDELSVVEGHTAVLLAQLPAQHELSAVQFILVVAGELKVHLDQSALGCGDLGQQKVGQIRGRRKEGGGRERGGRTGCR